ncbi:hypothetical protein FNJ88_10065 [Chryseobacterium sp. SNU WT5]|uniref:hypothetical protein n=1 Tax=Chryseobacterium sp. SNU WT5 TaxID=2594269 RepID=UPI00117F3E3B|nr:hypothetical protein [Chryseobacterium sp. SNU WT5]QDP85872.1 hypothetical protein FNJ88_10065 [Chryseobacterium sp. SNU WT5]
MGTEVKFFEALTGFFDFTDIKSLNRKVYFADEVVKTARNPVAVLSVRKGRWVIKFPSLQHRHFTEMKRYGSKMPARIIKDSETLSLD